MNLTHLRIAAAGAFLAVLFSCSGNGGTVTGDLDVIPKPQVLIEKEDAAPFAVTRSTEIVYPADNEKLARTAEFLASYIEEVTGVKVRLSDTPGKHSIILSIDQSIPEKDGYRLDVSENRITVEGQSEAAVFYGVQTIHKALPITVETGGRPAVPAGSVYDFPRFGYRGFMVDVGRHFFSVDYLKELIDVMALHNINYFHWHLTEDQGWRIEIKKYPKLTEIGSVRKETITAPGSGKYDGVPVSGFYTQEEAREIVRYAAERFITVIPEVDMPGHMMAALAAYPELGCTGGPYEVQTRFGVFKEVLCGGKEQTLQFAKDVLSEIMDIFPSEYIHIGGDECPKARWKECPVCQARIRELGLKDTPEHTKENQLQVWFMGEVKKEIESRGRKMLAWDEILDGDPDTSVTVMAWTGVDASIRSARLGHKTIVCPISHLYFSNPGYNRLKGVSSVQRVYDFNPVSDKLTDEQKKNIIGVQACIWTEWTKDSTKMEWQMMPRIDALSELQWSDPSGRNLGDFLARLRHQLDLYRLMGLHYRPDIENPVIDLAPSGEAGKAVVTLSTFDGAAVYYTLDGTDPSSASEKYAGPFTVSGETVIKAVAVRNGRNSETVSETLKANKVTMCPIELSCEPDPQFTYKGASIMNDGLFGDDSYRSGRYLGIYGQDLDVTFDLLSDQTVSTAFINTMLVPGDFIFGLTGLEVYVSEDGKSFRKAGSARFPVLEKGSKNNVPHKYEISFAETPARYVRIVGKCTPELPAWHPGAGRKAFLFVDEIGVD